MKNPDLIFYPTGDLPERLIQLNCDQCLGLLMPYLQSCRESGRIASAVAEIDFPNGAVVWFTSEDGTIDVHRDRPRFGTSRHWFGFIPALMRRHSQADVTNETIHQIVRFVYDNPVA